MRTPDTGPMPLESQSNRRKRFNYDPTVNLGHVLSLAAFLSAGSVAYFDLRQRVALTEQRVVSGELEAAAEKLRMRETLREIKDDMREVRKGVDSLQQRRFGGQDR